MLGLLVPLHLPFALPSSSEGAQLGWWGVATRSDTDAPLLVRQTIWSARSAGLRPGDVLLTVNGAPATAKEVEQARQVAEPGDTLELRVNRGDAELELRIPVRASTLSYQGYLWYRLALSLAACGISIALVLKRGRHPATLALALALTTLPPVLSPIELPPRGQFFGVINAIWQIEAAAYRFFFPILILHFLTLPLRRLRPLGDWRVWAGTYTVLGGILLIVTNTLTSPVAWASPGLQYTVRSWAGLVTEALVLVAVLYAIRPPAVERGPARWLGLAAVVTFGIGVTISLIGQVAPHAGLLAEALRQVKSIMLLIVIVLAGLYTALVWDHDGSDWHYGGRLAATASAVLTGLYAFAVAGAAAVIHSFEQSPDIMGAVLFVGIFIATLAYSPVLRWAREMVVDRQALARWDRQEQRVHEFNDRLATELSPTRIAQSIPREIPGLLGVRAAKLVLSREAVADWDRSEATGLEVLPRAVLEAHACARANGDASLHEVTVAVREPDGTMLAALVIERDHPGPVPPPARAVQRSLAQGLASALRNARAHMLIRAAERELLDAERIAALGALAGGLAHEIKNPLAGLKMGLYLLEHGKGGGDAKEKYERIQSDVRRIDDLVNGVLRLTHGGLQDEPEPVDLHEIIRQCVDDVTGLAADRQVELVERSFVNRAIVWGQRDQVRLIVSNLLRNALDAVADTGTVEVVVDGDDTSLELRVSDDGPGIPQRHVDRVFDLSFTTKTGGSGLGLALVRQEAERLGGSASVHARAGRGTELRIRLPRTRLRVNPAT